MRRLLLLPALALVLVGTPVLALEQPAPPSDTSAPAASASGPAPTVTDVALPAAQDTTVQEGFQQEVPVDASIVGVTWEGDPNAEFSIETRDASGTWQPAETVDATDTAPDDGGREAERADAARRATEPIWVRDATAVRVRLEDGTAADVKVAVVDSTPRTPQPTQNVPPDSTTTTPPPSSTASSSTSAPPTTGPVTTTVPETTTTSSPPTTTAPTSDPAAPAPPPDGDGGQAAPPGSAGAASRDWLPSITGPQRYSFAGALFALALLLGAIALGWSPWRARRARHVLVLGVLAALVLSACRPIPTPATTGRTQPRITMRAGWGAAPPPGRCIEFTAPLRFAVVHHTVNSNSYGPGESAGMVRGIQAYHQGTLGYCDIAYNFLVDKYGQIFEGRFGGSNGIRNVVLGAHTGGFNSHSTGIALIGDYRSATISSSQWRSLVHLLQWKLSIHGIDATSRFVTKSNGGGSRFPAGRLVSFPTRILGHTDLWPTECPGANVMSQLGRLRVSVQRGIVPPTTTTTPNASTPGSPGIQSG